MRAEDTDWMIYHAVCRIPECRVGDLCVECGLDEELVKDSLKRLSRNLLIVFRGDRVRARSVGEFMITNQMMHDPDPDLIIENGVVRVRESSAVGMNKEPGGNVL